MTFRKIGNWIVNLDLITHVETSEGASGREVTVWFSNGTELTLSEPHSQALIATLGGGYADPSST